MRKFPTIVQRMSCISAIMFKDDATMEYLSLAKERRVPNDVSFPYVADVVRLTFVTEATSVATNVRCSELDKLMPSTEAIGELSQSVEAHEGRQETMGVRWGVARTSSA